MSLGQRRQHQCSWVMERNVAVLCVVAMQFVLYQPYSLHGKGLLCPHLYTVEIMSLRQIKLYIKIQAPQQKLPVKVEQLPQDIATPASALYVALFIWTTAQVRPPPGGAD